jgi:hypothetical protein
MLCLALQSWNQVKTQVRVSSLQWSILNAVRNAGFRVHPEYNDGVFSIDMAVFLPNPDGDPIKVSFWSFDCNLTDLIRRSFGR